MARTAAADTSRAGPPRGTKTISTAFFAALDGIKEADRPEAAKAALTAIKATIAQNRIKAREAAGKAKAKLATARTTTSRSKTKDAAPTVARTPRRAAAGATKAPRRGRAKAAPAAASESPSAD